MYRFPCMFSDSDLLTYMYLLDLGFTVIFLILLVISCTCMPGPHHLIVYTCACYARNLALSYVLAGVANNPGSSCPDPRVCTVAALLYLIRVAHNSCLSGPSFQPPWSAREIRILLLVSTFLYFILYILLLCFLVIIYSRDIISCFVITVYWYYYWWIVCYHCASLLWFLPVLMLSVYTCGFFQPAYIHHSNVSVPAGSGRYRVVSEPRLSHPRYNQSAN